MAALMRHLISLDSTALRNRRTERQGAPMPNSKEPKPADYTVGYRHPPKATQFVAGKSGNPKGRPKGSRSVGAVLELILRQRVAVTENGKTRRIPVMEVMLRRLAGDAMRSDPRALKLLLSIFDQYSGSPETTIRLSDALAEDDEILARYLPGVEQFDETVVTNSEGVDCND
jgi:hypothetical protein